MDITNFHGLAPIKMAEASGDGGGGVRRQSLITSAQNTLYFVPGA